MKEKVNRKMVFVVQESLYRNFKDTCEDNYITMSQNIRSFMLQYIKEHKNGENVKWK